MINFDDVTKGDTKENNSNRPQISHHPYRILIIGGSRFGKTNSFFNLISHQPYIDKIYLHAKDPVTNWQKRKYRLKVFKRFKSSNDINDIYKNFAEYNPNKKRKILIADMLSNKKFNPPMVTELFLRARKLNISLFSHTILFRCSEKYWTKFCALLYYKNSKQTRTSTNCI